MKWTRDVRPEGIGLHSALLWSERQRLGVALVASIVTHGFALALTPMVQLEPQALPEVLQVEVVALAAPATISRSEPDGAPPDGARGAAPAQLAPETAPPEPPPPEAVIEAEPPKPRPARAEKKPKLKPASKPPERIERDPPSPPPEPPPAGALAQVNPIADPSPVAKPQIERSASVPEPPVETAGAEPQQLALAPPSRQAALEEYRRAVSKLVVRDRRYPHIARARGWEGTVNVAVRIGPGQTVHEITIERSSGFKVLDAEALKMVERAQPFPPVPKALGEVVVTVPVSFELRN